MDFFGIGPWTMDQKKSMDHVPKKYMEFMDLMEIHRYIALLGSWHKYSCDVCSGKVLNGEHELKMHLQYRAHQKRKSAIKKRKQNEEAQIAVRASSTHRDLLSASHKQIHCFVTEETPPLRLSAFIIVLFIRSESSFRLLSRLCYHE